VIEDRDGYLFNTTSKVQADATETGPDRSRDGIRAKLDFPDLLGGSLRLTYERVSSDAVGPTSEVRHSEPVWVAYQRQFDPEFDTVPYNEKTSVHDTALYLVDIETVLFDLRRELFGWQLGLLAGHSVMEFDGKDVIPTAAPSFTLYDRDRNPQTTVELRAHSPALDGLFGIASLLGFDLGTSDVLAGFFFQRRAIDGDELGVFNVALYGLEAATAAPANLRLGGLPIVLPSLLAETPPPGFEEDFRMGFEQTSTSIAGFTHVSWTIAPATLEAGMRFTHETKDADWNVQVERPGPLVIAVTGGGFRVHKELSESAFTPKVSLLWDWTDGIKSYAFWAKGFKGGGFNEFAFSPTATTTVSAEETEDWEVGLKTRLLDGAMTANLGLFRQDVDNLQVFQTVTLPPSAKSVNAGRARSQGVELDLSWLVTEWFDLYGALGYQDAKYLEYPLGSCSSDKPDSDGNGDGGCDLSGRQLEKAPRWSATVVPGVHVPLRDLPGTGEWAEPLRALAIVGSLTAEYQDVHKLSFELARQTRQDSFFRFAATLGFANDAHGWSAGVTAENFTSAEVSTFNAEIYGPGNYRQYPIEPRLVFGWLRWSF
jgi:outer membrane receptor protein involved in Fe transport